jgi:hypothetical protein
MGIPARPLNEIHEEGVRLLVREMGAADAARFISQFTAGHGDYTEERKKLFEGLTIDEVVAWSRQHEAKRED